MAGMQPNYPAVQPASKIKQSSFIGVGCLVQALGLMVAVAGAQAGCVAASSETTSPGERIVAALLGSAVGVAIFVAGSRMSVRWLCSACRSRLPDRHARVCAACRAPLKP